jgi:hypothetical protein
VLDFGGEGKEMSQEMQAILWIVAVALLIALVWALWRRTARQSLTVLLLAIGAIVVVGGGVPLVWWQLHLPRTGDQTLQIRDHRLVSQTQTKERDVVRLEAEIEIIIPKLTQERLHAIADAYLSEALPARKPDIAVVRLKDSTGLCFINTPIEQRSPLRACAHGSSPRRSLLGASGRTHPGRAWGLSHGRDSVTMIAKWAHLKTILGENALPSAWAALDESLYDYIVLIAEA